MTDDISEIDRAPRWIELQSIPSWPVVEKITGLSRDTLKRRYRHLVVKLSPRRDGLALKHALAIARGEIAPSKAEETLTD